MSDPLQKVASGTPFRPSAKAWNLFLDTARELRAQKSNLARGLPATALPPGCLVYIRNDTEANLARFGILGIDGPLFDPGTTLDEFQARVAFTGSTPTADHVGKFVIAIEPIAAGEVGRAMVNGVSIAQLNVADAADEFAEVNESVAALATGAEGSARILWKDTGSNPVWGIVRLGEDGEDAASASGQGGEETLEFRKRLNATPNPETEDIFITETLDDRDWRTLSFDWEHRGAPEDQSGDPTVMITPTINWGVGTLYGANFSDSYRTIVSQITINYWMVTYYIDYLDGYKLKASYFLGAEYPIIEYTALLIHVWATTSIVRADYPDLV